MIKLSKIVLFAAILFGVVQVALADRGIGKKNTNTKVKLNITTATTLTNSLSLNTKYGLKYKGSVLVNQQVASNYIINNSLVTYQKGNTTYIIPYKQKILLPVSSPGYAGFKLVFQSH